MHNYDDTAGASLVPSLFIHRQQPSPFSVFFNTKNHTVLLVGGLHSLGLTIFTVKTWNRTRGASYSLIILVHPCTAVYTVYSRCPKGSRLFLQMDHFQALLALCTLYSDGVMEYTCMQNILESFFSKWNQNNSFLLLLFDLTFCIIFSKIGFS